MSLINRIVSAILMSANLLILVPIILDPCVKFGMYKNGAEIHAYDFDGNDLAYAVCSDGEDYKCNSIICNFASITNVVNIGIQPGSSLTNNTCDSNVTNDEMKYFYVLLILILFIPILLSLWLRCCNDSTTKRTQHDGHIFVVMLIFTTAVTVITLLRKCDNLELFNGMNLSDFNITCEGVECNKVICDLYQYGEVIYTPTYACTETYTYKSNTLDMVGIFLAIVVAILGMLYNLITYPNVYDPPVIF